jgi:heme/copper-type cytochrome/quinol oxidase subunit 4
MSSPDLKNEINAAEVEPLLPIEKKLIGWSLGLGLTLLAVLIAVNHFVPIQL